MAPILRNDWHPYSEITNKSRNGKIPIFTIHDCICTVVGEEKELYEFMENKLREIFDTPPMMKVKYW